MRRTVVVTLVALLAVSCGGTTDRDRPDPLPPLPDVDPPVAADPAPMSGGTVDRAWLAASARSVEIPRRVLRAYVSATVATNAAEPSCELAWNTVAAIGHIESIHGAVNGSRIRADGVARPRIRGIPLDGRGVKAIEDTEDGDLDGDRRWDRAVGPMQFIPTTWARWASDGDGDGVRNPQDVDDAALAAGRYLCASGKRLGTRDGWLRAIVTYNRSASYVQKVSSTATRYAERTGSP